MLVALKAPKEAIVNKVSHAFRKSVHLPTWDF